MNLLDYIGDTRTDSLPPGFLKSMKIKYRHEASHVFAGLPPCSPPCKASTPQVLQCNSTTNESLRSKGEDGKGEEENGEQTAPSFMSWRVPSRLLKQKCEEALPSAELNNKVIKTKSASTISRRSTANISRSLSGISSTRSQKNAKLNNVDNKTPIKQREMKEDASKMNSKKSSTQSNDKILKKHHKNVKSANPKVLKRLKANEYNGSTIDEKVGHKIHANSQENLLECLKKEEATHDDLNNKNTKQLQEETTPAGTTMVPEEKIKNLNETDGKTTDGVLPLLKASENRTSAKLSQTPERMNKINDWVKKSSRREREAAFNLLSAYNNSENIQTKTPKGKERVRRALQALERKRLPDSIEPVQLDNIKRNLTAIKLDQKVLENYSSHVTKREKAELQTWHHVPNYSKLNITSNRNALFVQPSKTYQRHFSIHPEWGLHTRVKFVNSITT